MINYLNLPRELLQFTKPIDFKSLVKDRTGHDWCSIPTSEFLTDEGILWFTSRKFVLSPTAFLFKIVPEFEGAIHLDSDGSESTEFAFNFILLGKGKMQWVDNIVGDKIISTSNNARYIRYDNVKSFRVTDAWDGDLGLVRINSPHRIVSGNEERYCVSIRTDNATYPRLFNDTIRMIYT